ncbi:MAG: transcriptional regulator [Gammaproteobacteria bacterium]|jgi:transcriptional regulator
MYIPKHFEVTDEKEIYGFIEANAFGQLISNSEGRLFSTHIPFSLSNDKTKLLGHLAKQNPQGKDIEGQEILVTLQGAHDYISPSWYVGSGVPTWNYQSVHIYGKCKVFNEPSALKNLVETLTNNYESGFTVPWQPQYNPSILGAIVGVEISISEVQCKYKLSQNRPVQDQEQVIENLRSKGSIEIAEAMERNEL